MRAAIGFWTWLGREEGTLHTNEVNSHTPTNRREQVNPNPRPNRIATFPPTLEENETELDSDPNIPRINPNPRDKATNSPPPPVWKRAITKVKHPRSRRLDPARTRRIDRTKLNAHRVRADRHRPQMTYEVPKDTSRPEVTGTHSMGMSVCRACTPDPQSVVVNELHEGATLSSTRPALPADGAGSSLKIERGEGKNGDSGKNFEKK